MTRVLTRLMLCVPVLGLEAGAATFALEWRTVDGGSGCAPPSLCRGALRGSGFDLTGGFRPRVPVFDRDDLNCDRRVDFGDINPFVWLLTH